MVKHHQKKRTDSFKDFTYWKNRRCAADLQQFRSDLESYIDHSSYSYQADAIIEDALAKDTKVRMNRALHRARAAINATGLPSIIIYSPPPAVGGYQQRVDLLNNLFHLHQFQISQDRVIELIDRVIGIYEDDKWPSILRSVNPFWWLWRGLLFVSSLPFQVLSAAGFDTASIENSFVGRLVRLAVMFVMVFAAFLTVLQLLGYLEKFKKLVSIGV